MNSIIIYFSLTGNTKKVARAIHKGMSQLSEQCDIAKIKEVDIQGLSNYDLIGLGSPVWGGVPPNVERFIKNLPLLQGKHAFVFSTYAAEPEPFFGRGADSLLGDRGLTVIGIRSWYGAPHSVREPKPYPSDGHPDEIDLKEAEDFGREMAELSRKVSVEGTQVIPPRPVKPITLRQFMRIPMNPKPRPKLNTQKCRYPKCHLCIDNCPEDAIDLSASPPVFAEKCWPCFFCELICPTGAIEVDYDSWIIKDKFWRVEMDMEKTVLDKAEAEGRFRRLVPREDIDWETPFYKVRNKHPRYVIPKE